MYNKKTYTTFLYSSSLWQLYIFVNEYKALVAIPAMHSKKPFSGTLSC